MDCRRWAVDDDRSQKKWAVDEDRRRIRWAVDEDRHRKRWTVDDDRRRRRKAVDDDRRHEPLWVAQVMQSLDRMDDLCVKFMHSVERTMSRSATIPASSLLCSSNTHEQPTQLQRDPSVADFDFMEENQFTMSRADPPSEPTHPASLQIPAPLNLSATHPQIPPAQTKPHPTTAAPSKPAAADQTAADQLPVPPAADQAPAPPAPVSGDSAPWQCLSGDLAPGSDSYRGGESHRLSSRDFAPPTLLSLSDPTASTPVSHKSVSTFVFVHDQPRFTPVCDQILLPELPTASFRSSKRPSIPAFTGDPNLQSSTRACSIYTHSLQSARYPSPTSPIRSASTKPCEQLASDDANMEARFAPQTPAQPVILILRDHAPASSQINKTSNVQDSVGIVPLWEAVLGKHEPVIRLLIDNGADLSHGDMAQYACTAAEHNSIELLKDIVNYGGDIPMVKVSALNGENVDELLETVMLVAEMQELKANPHRKAKDTYSAGVNMPCLNSIDKIYSVQCTQTIRRNVNEGSCSIFVLPGEETIVGRLDGSVVKLFLCTNSLVSASASDQASLILLGSVPTQDSGGTLDLNESNIFLELTDMVHADTEVGVMALAFHPNFTKNEHFFVSFNCDKVQVASCSGRYQSVVSEFIANSSSSTPSEATSAVRLAEENIENKIFDPGICLLQQPLF